MPSQTAKFMHFHRVLGRLRLTLATRWWRLLDTFTRRHPHRPSLIDHKNDIKTILYPHAQHTPLCTRSFACLLWLYEKDDGNCTLRFIQKFHKGCAGHNKDDTTLCQSSRNLSPHTVYCVRRGAIVSATCRSILH